jgi:hypothetical protein
LEDRPISGFILSLLGGLFIVLATIVGLVLTPAYSSPYYTLPSYYYPFLLTSGVCGLLVLLAAAELYLRPELHVPWGIVVLVLSVTAVVGALTGYFALFGVVGVVFGTLGGAMSIAWKMGGGPPSVLTGVSRMCPGCARYVPASTLYCAFCGTPSPMIRQPAAGVAQQPPWTPPPK